MDIAKYITSAVILSSVFGQMSQTWLMCVGGALSVIVTLGWGLYLLKAPEKKK